ncbi:NAD(P)H-dependent oxidoreductase [Streptomyces sp. NK08204]|uniref:NAD(P)H-dependent oxidoreductase n=1 Tax=Streptomyces sp. NK08204 TaxID=2873260 RepID=UPI001CEC76EA|nr:NADPH-dependent FMN reductase [Streptomyces sp. NK08204]
MSVRILGIVGAIRAGSHNRQLAEAALKLAPEGTELVLFEGLADVPLFNPDLDVEGAVPEAAQKLRDAAQAADGFLIFTPEHNGTIPAALKSAIDWLSRPYGAPSFGGKPVVVIGTSMGQYGGVWAQDETRKSVGIGGGKPIEDIKLSIPGSMARFAQTHPADDAEVVAQLTDVLERVQAVVAEHKAAA